MTGREQGLSTLGVTVGSKIDANIGNSENGAEFSAYATYTPVTIRSHTVRTDHAGVELDQSRD